MTDVWSQTLYQASFGGVEFDCLATSDSLSRSIVRHEYPRRDGADLQDMGAEPRVTRCRLLFWERPPLDGEAATGNHLQRFAAFLDAVRAGKAQDFVHPITGTYRAMVESFDYDATADERDAITAECVFVEDTTAPAQFDPGRMVLVDAGAAAVRVHADQANAELAAAGIDSSAATDAAAAVDGWESAATSVREVNLQLASIGSQIDGLIAEYELASSIENYALWRTLQRLHYSCRRAAALFRQAQPQIVTLTLAAAQPLRVVATELYGADGAEAGYAEMMRLNDIDDPSLIAAGTSLRAPAPRRRATRRAA